MATVHGFNPTGAFQGTLAAIPPQAQGFSVGDVVVLSDGLENPAKDNCTSQWFDPTNLNLHFFYNDFTPDGARVMKGSLNCGTLSAAAAKGSFNSRVTGLLHWNGGVEAANAQTVTLSVTDPHITDATAKLTKDYLYDEMKMAKVLQSQVCKKTRMTKNSAVVGIVTQSIAGDLAYGDKSGSKTSLFGSVGLEGSVEGVPVAASMGSAAAQKSAASNSVTSKSSVFAFSLLFYKVALVEGEFYTDGPYRALREGSDIRKAASWLKLGDLTKKTKLGREKNGLKGMAKTGHYIAAQADLGITWQQNNDAALQAAHNAVELKNPFATAAAFVVTHDQTITGSLSPADEYNAAYGSLINFVKKGQDDSMDTDEPKNQGSFRGSMNVILLYDQATLSNIFEKLKACNKGFLKIGNGWYLKGMRVALEFDMDQLGLVPVSLPAGTVDTKTAPAQVFRCLEGGAFLLTPVDGIPHDDCGGVGRIFGNGDCADWSLETTVEFLDQKLSNHEATKKALELEGFTAVERSADDIDHKHKIEHVKMIRYILSPPLSGAGSEETQVPVVVDAVQEIQKKIHGTPAAVSPGRPAKKKQKMSDMTI